MRVSTKSQYGLRAMVYLAKIFRKGRIVSLKEISQKEDISFDYLEKIISKLEKMGLIRAKKGVRGGYYLAKIPSKIKVGQIIKALEGEVSLVKCIAKKERFICPRARKCLTKIFWQKLQKSFESALDSITLADLIKG